MRLILKAFLQANRELGVQEGENNPRIIEYLRTVNLDESEMEESTPWCSAFVNFCLQKSGGRGTHNAMARSFLTWGRKLTTPEDGCIVVLWRGSPDSDSGHVGFFCGYSQDGSQVKILGGNENNMVMVKEYPSNRILGFRTSKD